jgi:hypothetical protein
MQNRTTCTRAAAGPGSCGPSAMPCVRCRVLYLPYFIDIRVIALAVIVQCSVTGSGVARLDEVDNRDFVCNVAITLDNFCDCLATTLEDYQRK